MQPLVYGDEIISTFFDKDQAWNKHKIPSDWGSEDNLLDNKEFNATLKNCMEALPEKWNICMKLKYLSGKKGEDICQELEINPTNFWQILHRAKLSLRDCIETNWI